MSSGPGSSSAGSSGSGRPHLRVLELIIAVVGVVATIVFGLLAANSPARGGSDPTPTTGPGPSMTATVDPGPTETTEPTEPTETTEAPDTTEPTRTREEPPATSGPSMAVSPRVIDIGDELRISGSGFPPGAALHLRWLRPGGISYELARDVVADEDGAFQAAGPMENPGFCGAGAVAAFPEDGSSITVPSADEAVAGADVSMRC